jgi:hypothetical protein
MKEITNGRNKQCKNAVGGVKSVYLAPYKKVTRSNITYNGVELTGFPQTFIYKFEMLGASTFSQSQQITDGGKSYNQSLSLNFSKISAFDNVNFSKLLKKDYFIVVEDYNDNFFLMGFRNGAESETLTISTNQTYNISFSGQEENIAPFCNNLINTSLIIFDGFNYIFNDSTNYIFQNDNNYIFQ